MSIHGLRVVSHPRFPYESVEEPLLEKEAKAIIALKRAFETNRGSPFVARSLARLYERAEDIAQARETLTRCLDMVPSDKTTNAALARLLAKWFLNEGAKAELHWRRSFTNGDANYWNQLWYARQLFINGNRSDAKPMFDTLRLARADPSVKHQVVGRIRDVDGRVRIYGGSVAFLEATYAWVSADSGGFRVYAHRAQVEHDVWQGLRPGQSVQFAVGFNYFGPSASGLKIA